MNVRFVFSLLALAWFSLRPGLAQQRLLSAAEAAQPARLLPLTLPHLAWVPGSDDLAFVEGAGADQVLVRFSAGPGRKSTVLSLPDLNTLLKNAGGTTVSVFPEMQWTSPQGFVAPVAGQLFTVDVKARLARPLALLPAPTTEVQVHPGLQHTAFTTQSGSLFVAANGKQPLQIAENAQRQPIPVTSKSLLQAPERWSPQGQSLAFIINKGNPEAETMRIGVYDVQNQQTVRLDENAAWPYVVSLTWAPDGQTLLAGQLNREQDHLRLNQFDIRTGRSLKTLLEERHAGPVRPRQGPVFLPNRPNQFLWLSARDGFDHLYLYDTGGQEIRRLTAGNWVVTEVLGFGAKGNTAYYTSTAESPLERHFYSLNLLSGQTNRISQGTGVHEPLLSPTGSYFLNSFSSFVVANQIRVLEAGGKIRHTLLTDRNPLEEYRTGDVDLVPIKAPDGTDLYSRLITPPSFDRSRRYPVVIYLNENPREQRVLNTWLGGGELWMHWLAQKGYLVFELDGRGTANRGRAFSKSTFGQQGQVERQDQQAGIAYLQTLPYVDANRIGILGLGAGGYLAIDLLALPASSVKAGIALYPTARWPSYHVPFPTAPSAPVQKNQRKLPPQARLLLVQAQTGSGTEKDMVPETLHSDPQQVETFSPKTPSANLSEVPTEELLLQIHRFLEENL